MATPTLGESRRGLMVALKLSAESWLNRHAEEVDEETPPPDGLLQWYEERGLVVSDGDETNPGFTLSPLGYAHTMTILIEDFMVMFSEDETEEVEGTDDPERHN
jgi:hypothetical protein